jgi:hypothetical protein
MGGAYSKQFHALQSACRAKIASATMASHFLAKGIK